MHTQKQLNNSENQKLNSMVESLVGKYNHYIKMALVSFIGQRLRDIERSCQKISATQQQIYEVKFALMEQVSELNFLQAYLSRELRRSTDDFYIEESSLAAFIYGKKSELKDTDLFVMKALKMDDKKSEIISTIKNIKETINQYTGSNKRDLVNQFNIQVDTFIKSLDKLSYFDAALKVPVTMQAFLGAMETKNDSYYISLNFLNERRKQNSTLGEQIKLAKEQLNQFYSEDMSKHTIQTKSYR